MQLYTINVPRKHILSYIYEYHSYALPLSLSFCLFFFAFLLYFQFSTDLYILRTHQLHIIDIKHFNLILSNLVNHHYYDCNFGVTVRTFFSFLSCVSNTKKKSYCFEFLIYIYISFQCVYERKCMCVCV